MAMRGWSLTGITEAKTFCQEPLRYFNRSRSRNAALCRGSSPEPYSNSQNPRMWSRGQSHWSRAIFSRVEAGTGTVATVPVPASTLEKMARLQWLWPRLHIRGFWEFEYGSGDDPRHKAAFRLRLRLKYLNGSWQNVLASVIPVKLQPRIAI